MKVRNIFLFVILVFVACKEEFPVVSPTDEKILVIEGGITNNPGPYSIRLSTTSPLIQPFQAQKSPYPDCHITIFDNVGHAAVLTETDAGVYETSPDAIRGQPGLEYHIEIVTPEGKHYSSAPQIMTEPIGIDSVYADLTYEQNPDYPFGLPGYQFFVDTKPGTENSYVLWKMEETYKYNADYPLYVLFLYGNYFYMNRDYDTIQSVLGLDYDTLYTCWNTRSVANFFTGRFSGLNSDRIEHQPLHFVSTDSKKLSIKYSLLLQQYSLGKDAYYYWKNVEEQVSEDNYLYSKQPYNVAGNIENIDDSNEMVLGYFTVAAVEQKRIFVDKPNAPFYYKKGYFSTDLKDIAKKAQPVYLILTEEGKMGFVQKDCLDCRTEGGTVRKPDFWVDL